MIPIEFVPFPIPLEKRPIDVRPPTEVKLLCPICKFSYVHIGGVSYAGAEHDPLGVRMSGKTVRLDSPVPATGRGDRVFIEFWGECGHRFGLLIQHHKGETFLYRIDPANANADGGKGENA